MWLRSHPQLYSLYNLFPYLMIHPVPSAPVTLHQHCVKKHIGKAAKPRTGECSRVCPNPPWDLQQLANGSPALCLDSWGGGGVIVQGHCSVRVCVYFVLWFCQAVIVAIRGSVCFVLSWLKEWHCLETQNLYQHLWLSSCVCMPGVCWWNNGIPDAAEELEAVKQLHNFVNLFFLVAISILVSVKPVQPHK